LSKSSIDWIDLRINYESIGRDETCVKSFGVSSESDKSSAVGRY
jgi:hypothetical protein